MTATIGDATEVAAFAQVLRQLGPVLSDGHIEDDQASIFRHDKWRRLAEVGATGLVVPEEFGGGGLDVASVVRLMEELGETCRENGLAFSLTTHLASTATPLTRFASQRIKDAFLPGVAAGELIGAHAITEPHSGSDAMAMSTRAREVDGDWTISGEKSFVSNGTIADLLVVYAKTGEPGRAADSVSTFLIPADAPGVTIGEPIGKMGLRTAPLCSVSFENVRVPHDHLLGRLGGGLLVLDYVMRREILYSFAVAVGEMKHRLGVVQQQVNQREQFGRPLAANQAVSHQVVDMLLGYENSKRWLRETADKLVRGRDVTIDIALTKLIISEAAVASSLAAVRLFGGYGFTTEYGLEKDLRASIGGTIYSGSNEVQRNRVAALMGLKVSS